MIYFILILFFASLLSIAIMIGRKLVLLKKGQIEVTQEIPFEVPYLKEIRRAVVFNIKKYEHLALVGIVKFHLQFANFLKSKYGELKIKLRNLHLKHSQKAEAGEKTEVSTFLKVVSVYKNRITEIKDRIKREENNN